jgi:hypothetical protein
MIDAAGMEFEHRLTIKAVAVLVVVHEDDRHVPRRERMLRSSATSGAQFRTAPNIFAKRSSASHAIPPSGRRSGVPAGQRARWVTSQAWEAATGSQRYEAALRRHPARNGVAISHTSGNRMGTDWRDNGPDHSSRWSRFSRAAHEPAAG